MRPQCHALVSRAACELHAGAQHAPAEAKLAYARAFNIDPKDVTKGQRQIGKVQELGLGYEGGVAAFLTFAAVYHMDLGELADAVHSTAPKEALAAAYGMWEWATKKRRTLGLGAMGIVLTGVLGQHLTHGSREQGAITEPAQLLQQHAGGQAGDQYR